MAPNLHVNKLLNMKKSHMENKETVTQGFFDANKTQMLNANKTLDAGPRFSTITNSAFIEKD